MTAGRHEPRTAPAGRPPGLPERVPERDTRESRPTRRTLAGRKRQRDGRRRTRVSSGTGGRCRTSFACVPGQRVPGQRGFILIATLWTLAVLAVVAAYIANVVESDVERAIAARGALQDEVDRRSTEATLLYLLATSRMSHRGLILETSQRFTPAGENPPASRGDGELTLGGEPHTGLGRSRFALQEENGLASVNLPGDPQFAAVLRRVGVPRQEIGWIISRIRDYSDLDDALSLNGAERVDYARRNRPPPANWFLATPVELQRVLGLDTALAPAQWHRLRPLLTARIAPGYNFNTMRPEVMAALLGVEESALAQLLAERDERPIADLDRVADLTGRRPNVDPDFVFARPSIALRISLWSADAPMRETVGLTLTPTSEIAPWRKEYWYTEPVAGGSLALRRPATALIY